jgi:hypothetical protein
VIAAVAVAHYRFKLNAVLAFWIAYILTRPLGASMGDLLSQDRSVGGLGLGTTVTSIIFLLAILIVVVFLQITRKDATEAQAAEARAAAAASQSEGRVLVVAPTTTATPALLDAVRARAARGPARFHLLIPNPADHAELTDTERERHHAEGERLLQLALPLIEEAAGTMVEGSVSIRHDPMDAIEETLRDGDFDEVIVSTLPHGISQWLHADLPGRIAHLGLPVTAVAAAQGAPAQGAPAPG